MGRGCYVARVPLRGIGSETKGFTVSTEITLPEQQYGPGTALATRPIESEGLDQGDILIPRMKIAQMISSVVANEIADYGAIFVVTSRDDMEPEILAAAPAKGEMGEPVRFYVHGDPRKGWSWKPAEQGGEWRGREYPDLRLVQGQDPRQVRRTYDFLVTLPQFPMLPVRFLMTGAWGGQAAKQINTQLLLKRQQGVPTATIAFKLQAKKTSSPKDGQERPFVQAIVGLDKVAAKDHGKDLELVNSHTELINSAPNVSEVSEDDAPRSRGPVVGDNAPSLD